LDEGISQPYLFRKMFWTILIWAKKRDKA